MFYELAVHSKIQDLFKSHQSPFNQSPLIFIQSPLENNTVRKINTNEINGSKLPKRSISPMIIGNKSKKSIMINNSKKKSTRFYPFQIPKENSKKSLLKSNHKSEKQENYQQLLENSHKISQSPHKLSENSKRLSQSPNRFSAENSNKYSENQHKYSENLFNFSETEQEKPKKHWISIKNESLKEVKRYPEALVASTPLKNRKVEGLIGFENQILYEIKTNGLTSLKKELVDPSEESRNSIASSMH